MKINSNNPGHEVYVDGFELLGEFIPYNTGVDRANTINQISGELTTGKTYNKYLNENSENLTFKNILPDAIAESGYENVLKSVVAKAKQTPVQIRFNGTVFLGMVQEFSISFPKESYREYKWVIVESEPFNAVAKTFNTFNYKKAATKTKSNTPKSSIPVSLKTLLNCKSVYNCAKRKVACVTAWQKQLKKDGYYVAYLADGNFCKYTLKETKKWQKHYKVKVTGKVDKATKLVLLKRYLNTSKYSAAYKKAVLQGYSKIL
jgi:hypothetical protein